MLTTVMSTGMLVQSLISIPGVFADVIPSNESLTETIQKENNTLPVVTLNSDRLGETITALNVLNDTLVATRTTNHVDEGYKVGYALYGSNSSEFDNQTATRVGYLYMPNTNNLAYLFSPNNISSLPVSQYYYVVDESASDNIPMLRINGSDLLVKASF